MLDITDLLRFILRGLDTIGRFSVIFSERGSIIFVLPQLFQKGAKTTLIELPSPGNLSVPHNDVDNFDRVAFP